MPVNLGRLPAKCDHAVATRTHTLGDTLRCEVGGHDIAHERREAEDLIGVVTNAAGRLRREAASLPVVEDAPAEFRLGPVEMPDEPGRTEQRAARLFLEREISEAAQAPVPEHGEEPAPRISRRRRPAKEARQFGVGVIERQDLVIALPQLPKPQPLGLKLDAHFFLPKPGNRQATAHA